MYGPAIKNKSSFYLPAGESKVSFVDVRDVAAIAAIALTNSEMHAKKAYEITGAKAPSYKGAAKTLKSEEQ